MEIAVEKAREYILALKEAGSFTFEDIANQSGIPLQTVRNILSGKTPDARFGTIAKLVISLGGDLNELIGYEKKKEIEVNSTVSLKETYEMRIADIIKSYETRIEDSFRGRLADRCKQAVRTAVCGDQQGRKQGPGSHCALPADGLYGRAARP